MQCFEAGLHQSRGSRQERGPDEAASGKTAHQLQEGFRLVTHELFSENAEACCIACCFDQRPLAKAAKMTAICQSALSNAARTTQHALVWEGLEGPPSPECIAGRHPPTPPHCSAMAPPPNKVPPLKELHCLPGAFHCCHTRHCQHTNSPCGGHSWGEILMSV